VIFRATSQWFLRVSDEFRAKLLASTDQVRWVPAAGQARMRGMLEGRPDWCVSRQRYWGTPIAVLHCVPCDEPILDVGVLEQIQRRLAEGGTELWFTQSPAELAPQARCPKCGGAQLRKETDILDVWFDSGVSHEAVLKQRPQLTWPASLYLEGSDQHRGWFQVSLIPSVALHGRPPFESVLTHGFVMDGEGRKMSKSTGNVVAPQQVTQRYGADVLRLWVAASDYTDDVRISDAILDRIADAYRKIRNTIRYLLSNLHDFRPADAQPEASLPEFDRWALSRGRALVERVTAAYDAYEFSQVYREIYQFCVVDLSAFYLDALKDRLYTEAANSPARRCAQTVLHVILGQLVRVIAPLLPMTADEAWQHMRTLTFVEEPSVHLASWPRLESSIVGGGFEERWETLLAVRGAVMKALEDQRAAGVIGSPLEARVTLRADGQALRELLERARPTLTEMCVVSQLQVADAAAGAGQTPVPGLAAIEVGRASGAKCARCWRYVDDVGQSGEHPQLCGRCVAALRAGS
jgi:isoleucyl-tRNA synthetase